MYVNTIDSFDIDFTGASIEKLNSLSRLRLISLTFLSLNSRFFWYFTLEINGYSCDFMTLEINCYLTISNIKQKCVFHWRYTINIVEFSVDWTCYGVWYQRSLLVVYNTLKHTYDNKSISEGRSLPIKFHGFTKLTEFYYEITGKSVRLAPICRVERRNYEFHRNSCSCYNRKRHKSELEQKLRMKVVIFTLSLRYLDDWWFLIVYRWFDNRTNMYTIDPICFGYMSRYGDKRCGTARDREL